jgi:branched-chain amino acid transport system permease protein
MALRVTLAALALLALAVVPFFAGQYALFVCAQMITLIYIAASLQVSFAYARVLSFMQGTFFGVGGYVGCVAHRSAVGLPGMLVLAIVASSVFGLVVGFVVTRMKGAHTSVNCTLLIATITLMCANSFVGITGGEDGLSLRGGSDIFGFPVAFGANRPTYFLALIPLVAYFVFTMFAERTTFGAVMKAVGSNETRAAQLGYNVVARHLVVFTITAGAAGYGGAMNAVVLQHVSSALFEPNLSLTAVLWAAVGGLGQPLGALYGALVVFPLTELAARLFQYVDIAVGALLIVAALLFPQGVAGLIEILTVGFNPERNPKKYWRRAEKVAARLHERISDVAGP